MLCQEMRSLAVSLKKIFFRLQKQIAGRKTPSASLKLKLAQLYMTQGHVYQACTVLRDMGNLSYKPGVVSTRSLQGLSGILKQIRQVEYLDGQSSSILLITLKYIELQ